MKWYTKSGKRTFSAEEQYVQRPWGKDVLRISTSIYEVNIAGEEGLKSGWGLWEGEVGIITKDLVPSDKKFKFLHKYDGNPWTILPRQ